MTRKNNENNKSRKMIRRLAVAGLATAVAVSLMPATALAAGGPEPGHDYYREEPMYGFMPEEHHGGGWYGEPHYGYYYDDFGRGCWCWYYPGMYGQPGWYDFGHGVYHDDHMGHGGHDDHDNGSWDQQIGG